MVGDGGVLDLFGGGEEDDPLDVVGKPAPPKIKRNWQGSAVQDVQPGMVLGRLTIGAETRKNGFRAFRCVCVCGQETVVHKAALKSGATRSCGCLRTETSRQGLAPGQSALNSLFLRCQKNALMRNRDFTLTIEEAGVIFKSPCHYCGTQPSMTKRPPTALRTLVVGADYTYNGLDRVDDALSYVPGNVVAACWPCNRSKSSMSLTGFLSWVSRVGHNQPPVKPVVDRVHDIAWKRYVEGALERRIPFNLNREEAESLFASPCYYCGASPSSGPKCARYSGIDRMDNAHGYEPANCVSACWPCNRAKGSGSQQDFLAWAARVQAHQQASTSTR